jgi:hypothetical protein
MWSERAKANEVHPHEAEANPDSLRSTLSPVGKRPLLGAALEFLVQRKPAEIADTEAPAEQPHKPAECAKCAAKAKEKESGEASTGAGGGCAHGPAETCASCAGKQTRPVEVGCAHSPFEACSACKEKKPRQQQRVPREGGGGQDAMKAGAGSGDAAAAGGQGDGEVQVGGDCEPCTAGEVFARAMTRMTAMPAEGERPREDGWWTGSWYTSSNTIICDGSGSLTVHESTNYPYGVQECTVKHENVHKQDWYDRYGKDVCKGRKMGDLPHFDPPGKQAYSAFLKASECKAWKVGEACRKEKLKACKDDTCKTEVQDHVDWAAKQVKKYCG